MPNLKYLNINGVNYSLGRDTRIHYGSTSETITDLQEGDLLIDLVEIPPAGKNLLPSHAVGTASLNGLAVTYKSDGSVTVNGTATANTDVPIYNSGNVSEGLQGSFILNGSTGGSASTYRLVARIRNTSASTNRYVASPNGDQSIETASNEVLNNVYITVNNGTTLSNKTFYPMVRLASVADATYESYNGNTYAVSVVGDQLINKSTNESGAIDANGNDVANTSFNRTQLISVNSGTLCFRITVAGFYNVRIHGYNNGTWIEQLALLQTNDGFNEISVSVPSTVNQVRVSYPVAGLNTSYLYKNYRGTIYGGTLDVVSGQLTVTHKELTFNGTQAVTDRISSQNRVYYQISDMATGSFYSDNNVMCNRLEKVASVSSDATALPATVIGYSNNYVYIQGVKNIGGANITDLASFNTWVSANNIVVTYPLATPLTYQLTATQVALLRGDSKIWSDSGDTSVIYTNINDTTSTASGSIANITSAKKALAQSVVTEINCKQNLNGYDHPWAGGAGKNILRHIYPSQTKNGVTFTENANGTVSTSGTATADAEHSLTWRTAGNYGTCFLKAGTYILSGCPSGGGSSKYEIGVNTTINNSGVTLARDYGSSATFTLENDGLVGTWITIRNGQNANGLTFKPMIRLASIQDNTWEPYENICPITGYNNINITKINPLYDTSETGTRMYKYNEDATWTEISVSGNGGLLNLENGSATGSVRGVNTFSEDGPYVMGQNAVAVGGSTQAAGANSFTSGLGTVAQRGSQAVFGEYNTLDTTGSTSTRGDYAFIIGNGTSNVRSNATTIDWEGSIDTHGAITAGSIDNGYGLNDQALLASDTIALWEDIING